MTGIRETDSQTRADKVLCFISCVLELWELNMSVQYPISVILLMHMECVIVWIRVTGSV